MYRLLSVLLKRSGVACSAMSQYDSMSICWAIICCFLWQKCCIFRKCLQKYLEKVHFWILPSPWPTVPSQEFGALSSGGNTKFFIQFRLCFHQAKNSRYFTAVIRQHIKYTSFQIYNSQHFTLYLLKVFMTICISKRFTASPLSHSCTNYHIFIFTVWIAKSTILRDSVCMQSFTRPPKYI